MISVKAVREELGLKQTELAEMLGVDAPLISKLENGVVLPSQTMVETLEKALASHSDARKGDGSINYSATPINPFKTRINGYELEELYEIFTYTSRSQPLTRSQLEVIWGLPDRSVRARIKEMQDCGCRIVSSEKGYYLARTPEEYEIYRKREKARARAIDRKIAAMDRNLPGQIIISD